MKKILSSFLTLCDGIYGLIRAFSRYIAGAIVLIVFAQIIARNIFRTNIYWSDEVSLLFLTWATFISLAVGSVEDLHIGLSVFFNMFPKPIQRLVRFLNQLLVFALGLVLLIYGIKLVLYTADSTLPATKWPMSVRYLMIPVSGFFISLYSFLGLLGIKSKYSAPEETDKEKEASHDSE